MADVSDSCFNRSPVTTILLALDAVLALTGAFIACVSSYYICKQNHNTKTKPDEIETIKLQPKYQILSIICNVGFGVSSILAACLILSFDLCIEPLVHVLGQSWSVFVVTGQLSMFALFIHRLKDVFSNTAFEISNKIINCFIGLLFLQIILILATLPMFIFVNLFYGFILFSCFLLTYFISSFLLIACFLKNLNDFAQFIAGVNHKYNVTIYSRSTSVNNKNTCATNNNNNNNIKININRTKFKDVKHVHEMQTTKVTSKPSTSTEKQSIAKKKPSPQASSPSQVPTIQLNVTSGNSSCSSSDSEYSNDNYNIGSSSGSDSVSGSLRSMRNEKLKLRMEKEKQQKECDEIKSVLIRYTLLVTIALTSTGISTIFMALASIINWQYFIIIVLSVFLIDALINIICLNLQFGFNLHYYQLLCKNCHTLLTICCIPLPSNSKT